MCLSSFSNTIYLKDYPFPIKYSWLTCQILVDGIVFIFIHLNIYAVV